MANLWPMSKRATGVGADEAGIVLWQHPKREEFDMAGLADIPTPERPNVLMVRHRQEGDVA